MVRDTHYAILDEALSSITHGIGAALSIAGLVCLLVHGVHEGGAMRVTTFAIYGSILIIFYIMSSLFHSLYFTRAEKVFQIFDHYSIYLLIAATYTPYCLVTIKGGLGWTIFGVIWFMTVLGIIYKSIWIGDFRRLSTIIYVIMGWMCLIGIKPLWDGLGFRGFGLLFLGGVTFTVGAVIYSIKSIPFGHVIWHLFVMLGTALMYFSIYFYV